MSEQRRPSLGPEQESWGDYDAEATGFVSLPTGGAGAPEGLGHPGAPAWSATAPGGDPLAAPGHGYTPPDLGGPTAGEPDGTAPAAGADPAGTPWAAAPTAPAGGGGDAAPATGGPGPGGAGDGGPAAAPGQGVADAGQEVAEAPAAGPGRRPPADSADWNAAPAGGHSGQWAMPAAPTAPTPSAGPELGPATASPEAAGPTPAEPPADDDTPAPHADPRPDPAAADDDALSAQAGMTPPEADPGAEAASPPDAGAAAGPTPDPAAGEPGAEGDASPEAPTAGGETSAGPDAATAPEGDAEEQPAAGAPAAPAVDSEHPLTSYVLRVNGVDRPVHDSWIGESLLYVLRERLGLAGAKDGCAQGECGACSVQVDGRLVASCLVPAATTAGSEIRTVEGLAVDGEPSDVQRALIECGAVQCGFCIPGMAMTVHDLLEGNHAPTELETRTAISGNLCRCSGYRGVLEAVRRVVEERAARRAEEAEAQQQAQDAPPQGTPGEQTGQAPSPASVPQQPGPYGDPAVGYGQEPSA